MYKVLLDIKLYIYIDRYNYLVGTSSHHIVGIIANHSQVIVIAPQDPPCLCLSLALVFALPLLGFATKIFTQLRIPYNKHTHTHRHTEDVPHINS